MSYGYGLYIYIYGSPKISWPYIIYGIFKDHMIIIYVFHCIVHILLGKNHIWLLTYIVMVNQLIGLVGPYMY